MLARDMWVFPLVAAIVAFAFAGLLVRSYVERRQQYLLAWIIALAMFGVASLAVVAGVAGDWSSFSFELYWALGAVLTVPFLAAGEVMLLFRYRWVNWAMWLLLVFLTAYAFAVLRDTEPIASALTEDLPAGRDVFGLGTPAQQLPQLISYPAYFALLAGTLWSAWKMRGRPELKDRFVGTLLIAAGATIVAAGAAFAAKGVLAGFNATLVVGIATMFLGFLRASRPTVASPSTAAPTTA
jgi:hypothetical protein